MATSSQTASSAHPPSAESPASRRKYDVFLSFRGEDTRRTIVSSIYHELQNRGIDTFMDDTGLIRGTSIAPSLLVAIQESRSAIVVLSPNYADSRWCLEELTMIIQCMEEKSITVIPIFYGVTPSDVRHQSGSFARAFNQHEEHQERLGCFARAFTKYRKRLEHNNDELNQRRIALTKVANLSGLESNKYSSDLELVECVVETACSNLRHIDVEWAWSSTGDFVEFGATRQAMDNVMTALLDAKITLIGVHGMGGVGKTSMVKYVGAQAKKLGLFHYVVIAVVSQTPDLRNIQGTLADLLGLKLLEETVEGRAARLMEKIRKGNNILIILDDIWERIDLSSIGIPSYEVLQRCGSKIMFTTRRLHVCQSMESQVTIPLLGLSDDDAWNLFVKKTRQSFHESTIFYNVARTVAKECAGLPVALVTVARALKDKDLDEWTEAARRLKAAQPANYEDEGDVFKCIKLSYDYLRPDDDNIAKLFFLLCCLFPEDSDIEVEDLLVYALGKGLFQDAETIYVARATARSVVNYLKASSLLLESALYGFVKMHDVIRDVAISISLSEDGSRFLVKAGCGLKYWPRITHEDYCAISLMRNEIHALPERLVCSKLQILLLQSNSISEIPNPFFQYPNDLRVLDLSETSISFLPSSLSLLTNLQALYLDECKRIVDISIIGKLKNLQILSMKNLRGTRQRVLPKVLGHLTNLKMLDVTDACFRIIPSEVISNLNGLEELYVTCDFCDWGSRTDEGTFFSLVVPVNASFDELTGLSRLSSLKVRISDVKCLPPLVGFAPNWVNFNICISRREFMEQSYYSGFFERKLTVKLDAQHHLSRYLTLNTSTKNLPDWFINVVTEKAEILEYTGYMGLMNIVVEYHHGKLHGLKYLGVIECSVDGELMNSITTRLPNRPVLESLEELYLEGVYGLERLCVGELTPKSLSNLKLLNVRNCPGLGVLLQSNLLHRLQNLEIVHCEYTGYERGTEMGYERGPELEYVFEFGELEPEQTVLPKLREVTLCYFVNLKSICSGNPSDGVFHSLHSLTIRGCHKLKHLFEYNVAQSLSHLELLWVEGCSDLETVTEPSLETEINGLDFPELKEIYLNRLPQLTWINGSFRCPSLKHLYVYKCPGLSNLAVSDFQSKNHVKANDEGHFAILFERLFHRQFNPEEVPQFFSKKESDFSVGVQS